MIKITKRLFFYAAFLLCAVLVFAVENESEIEKEKRRNRP